MTYGAGGTGNATYGNGMAALSADPTAGMQQGGLGSNLGEGLGQQGVPGLPATGAGESLPLPDHPVSPSGDPTEAIS